MTKKDYIKLAAVLRDTRDIGDGYDTSYDTWSAIVTRITRVCAEDNPRFDVNLFHAACGVMENSGIRR